MGVCNAFACEFIVSFVCASVSVCDGTYDLLGRTTAELVYSSLKLHMKLCKRVSLPIIFSLIVSLSHTHSLALIIQLTLKNKAKIVWKKSYVLHSVLSECFCCRKSPTAIHRIHANSNRFELSQSATLLQRQRFWVRSCFGAVIVSMSRHSLMTDWLSISHPVAMHNGIGRE